jgi:hypothetical protein
MFPSSKQESRKKGLRRKFRQVPEVPKKGEKTVKQTMKKG